MHKTLFVAILLTSLFLSPLVVFAQTSTLRVKVNIAPELSLVVRSTPAGARAGSQLSGAEGTVSGSPQIVGGKTWQQVDFDSGIDGWVVSSYLQSVGDVTPPPPPPAISTSVCDENDERLRYYPLDYPGWEGGKFVLNGFASAGNTNHYCFSLTVSQRLLTVVYDSRNSASDDNNVNVTLPNGTVRHLGGNIVYVPNSTPGDYRVSVTGGNHYRGTYRIIVNASYERLFPPPPPPPPSAQQAVNCPQGELPLLRDFTDVWGKGGVSINDGETHTYCFTVNRDTHRLVLVVGDRTGAAQCFWHTAEYIPPTNNIWQTIRQGPAKETGGTFFLKDDLIPKGVWRIKITADSEGPNCADRYSVLANY